MKYSSGFSLIELLVVIGIIGVLVSVVYASFDGARQEARNRAMQAEFKEVQLALELYRAQNDVYPPDGIVAMESALVPEFIASVPQNNDSNNPNCAIDYHYDAAANWYKLTGVQCYEGASSPATGIQQDNEFARCPDTCPSSGSCVPSAATFYESIAIYSAGGQCH